MRPGDHGTDPWEGTEPERPIDIEALRADDAFIESLMCGEVQKPAATAARERGVDVDAELRSMLSAWVLEVRPETVTAIEAKLPETPVAPAALLAEPTESLPAVATLPARRRPRLYHARRLLLAASVVTAVGSGLALGAYQSEPGSTLWPVTKVLYAEHARSVQAAADVTTGLDRARVALQEGRPAEAAEAIRVVRATLGQVAPAQGREELDQIQQQLSDALATVAPELAATLDMPPNPDAGLTTSRPVTNTAAPAPLTDRAAESGSTTSAAAAVPTDPQAPAAVVPAPVVPAPVVPAPVVPDPVVPVPTVPDSFVPDPVVPPPPEPGPPSSGSTATDPPAVEPTPENPPPPPPPPPPVEPAPTDAEPPATTDGGAAGSTGAGTDATGTASTPPVDGAPNAVTADPAVAPDVAPANAEQAPAAAATTPGGAPAHLEAPPSDQSIVDSLLTTVANAASETVQNVEAVAATGT